MVAVLIEAHIFSAASGWPFFEKVQLLSWDIHQPSSGTPPPHLAPSHLPNLDVRAHDYLTRGICTSSKPARRLSYVKVFKSFPLALT